MECGVGLLSTWHKLRHTLKDRISIEDLPSSEGYMGVSVVRFLDC